MWVSNHLYFFIFDDCLVSLISSAITECDRWQFIFQTTLQVHIHSLDYLMECSMIPFQILRKFLQIFKICNSCHTLLWSAVKSLGINKPPTSNLLFKHVIYLFFIHSKKSYTVVRTCSMYKTAILFTFTVIFSYCKRNVSCELIFREWIFVRVAHSKHQSIQLWEMRW